MTRPTLYEPGTVFGRLTIVRRAENVGLAAAWVCLCSCGAPAVALGVKLRSGETRSCGCLRRELTGAKRRTHGKSESRVFRIWCLMRRRCQDKNMPKWHLYGGRGITVCERWENFANFLADMGEPPARCSIDRINNDGNYEPGNCRWATQTEQTRNTRRNLMVEISGRSQCLSAWCEELGVHYGLAYDRLRRGWNPVLALETPRGGGRL